jgi:hypothetical protein
MFKLAVTFFSLFMLGLFLWSAYNLLKIYFLKNSNSPTKNDDFKEDLDKYIDILKNKIELAEESSKKGIVDATLKLENYKKQLEQAENLKQKHFN